MMKHLFRAFAALLLCLNAYGQTITVNTPNGGEILYSCQNYTITWSTSGTLSNYYDISYSLDGGTIWASVTTNYLSTNGQYVWSVPNVQSNTCLIRVRDAQNNLISDVSNALFTINIPVGVLSPNGGEVLQGGNVHTITWSAQGTSNSYNLYYSTNGGSTWTTIVTNYATVTGAYNWTVPNIPSTQCLIRVRDAVTACMQDESNAVFTIIADDPVLTAPNGAENWFPGCSYSITWNTATLYSTVNLEYSTNNGSSWTTIVTGTANDGNHTWTIPNLPSGTCLVRISNSANVAINDISDATFTIPAPITVVTPNGGGTLYGCGVTTVTWNKPNSCIAQFSVSYSIDNGATWNTISNPVNSGSGTTQSVSWTVPNGITTSQALVRVADFNNAATVFDVSNTNFSIAPSNDITVTAPNGGEILNALTNYTITWTNLPTASGLYNIQYNTGSGWTTLVSGITGNAYNWSVPNIPSTNCLVRVIDAVNTCKFDESNAVFTIVAATPILLTPNGGENLAAGCNYSITWNQTTFYSPVRLDYSTDGGTTWTNIITSTANDGNHTWTVPFAYSTNCLLKIANTSDLLAADVSNAPFSIVNPIAVLTPNGGETLSSCSNYTISWSRIGTCISQYTLSYSLNNGSTWNTIANPTSTGSSTQNYVWNVPNTTSAQALIRVADFNNPSNAFDISNAVFSITPNADITVTSPNGGEILNGLSTHTITWTNLPGASGQYTIQYSTDGGSNWSGVASNITGNAYIWNVPNVPSTNCLVRVIDALNTCKQDVSNAVFTINPPLPVLLTPNGGENIPSGCAYSITWNQATFYTNVRIDYSADGGTTWTNIVASTINDGDHNWTPPFSYGSNYLIKIANTTDLLTTDISAAPFSIVNPIAVLTPNGGETLSSCSNYTISWSRIGTCISQYALSYSLNNGSTWSTIANPTSTGSSTQNYVWNVPNTTSTQALIRVADFNNPSNAFDISNAVFSITPNADITVTSPNGGEVLNALSTHTITWTNLPGASGQYNLQYNTGSGWTSIATGITGNAYIWSIPNIPSTTCQVRVTDALNSCKVDVSDAFFTITPPLPVLLTPNGGETVTAGCWYTITWNQATLYTTVRIDYSIDGGTTWTNIVASTANDGQHDWMPPHTYSTNCLVKIANTTDLLTTDISAAPFSIVNPIQVTFANGGETLIGCSAYNISWSKIGNYCINQYTVSYSLNNGSTWSTISNPTNAVGATQSVSWTVPNGITNSQALIRVADFSNPTTVFDISNANFNIIPSNDITVTAPNGGEVLNAYASFMITWTNLPSVSGQYNVQYNTGSGWVNIVTGITGNAYNWTVPNLPSTTCQIRVVDAVNTCKLDVSDAMFTITPPLPVLLTPNGGETFTAGCSNSITWDQTTFYTTVRIDYSIDGGTTWTNLIASTANDGNHSWVPPFTYSTNCKIRICNTTDLLTTDISAAPFTIANPITVVTPNGGETVYGCSNMTITWNKPSSSCITQYAVSYSIDNGATWNVISIPSNGAGTSQSINWTVPNGISTSQALIQVKNNSNPAAFDNSNATFTIAPSNDITVTAPNGGETFQGLSQTTITWTNTPAASGQYNLYYSTNNGLNWSSIASNITGNSYNWTVANIPSTQCLILVEDYMGACRSDQSNAAFTITPATPILLTPNGGEVLYAGTSYNVTWNQSTFYSGTVRIDYSTNNGFTWNTVLASTTNDGTQAWSIPNVSSTQCLVRVSNTGNVNVNDVSNAVFTIKPAVTILTPNGNDGVTDWGGCTVTSITFDHSPAYSTWNIAYSLNGGNTWTTVANAWSQTANPATYNWNIPNTSSSNVLVRVEPSTMTSYGDVSDAPFTVDKPVTIIQPNFGGIMQVGSVYNITWSSDGISNIYDIFFSDNGGTTWSTVVLGHNTSTNTYAWNVPNAPSTNCKIRVRDNINHCKEDTSDLTFTISTVTPALTLLSPNGTETLNGCSNHVITWTEPSPWGTYDISYSLNSGASWTPIVTNYATATLSYNWIVPNVNTTNALIRVKATGTAIEDLSNALFSIQSSSIQIANADTTVCNGAAIQLQASGAPSYTWSPTTGLSDPNSANPIATPTATTTYTVQFVNGVCTLQDQITITTNGAAALPVSVAIAASPSNTICTGDAVTFTATPANGGATPVYQWKVNGTNAGTNSPTFTSSSLANNDVVTVVLTSSAPCATGNPATSNAITMSVSPVTTPSVSISSTAASICSGTAVTFTATPVNGGPTPSYQWKVNGNDAGTDAPTFTTSSLAHNDVVTVILTSGAVCSTGGPATSNAITMTVNTAPAQPGIILGTAAVCSTSNQTYSIASVPGATSYTWTLPGGWTGSSATTSITALPGVSGGMITVTANNTCGSSPVQGLPVSVFTSPTVTANATMTTICSGTPVTLYGTGATTYSWSGGVTNATPFSPTLSATYTVTGTDANGCTDTDMITVNVNAAPNVTANATATTLCGGGSVTLTGGGANSYSWNNGVTNGVAFTPASTQTYTVTGTGLNGCTNTAQVTVAVTALPAVNAGADVAVCSNTPVTLSGSGAQSYVWNNGVTNGAAFFPSSTQTYTVTGTDANGCTNTDQVTVTVNAAPTVVAQTTSTTACIGSTITLTGGGAQSYTWNNGVTNGVAFSPSSTQTYTVTGTDANGCTDTDQITIAINGLPNVTANATAMSVCPGGTVTLTGGGANNYSWNNGVTDGVAFSPVSTQTYTVTGTSAAGCTNTAQITIAVLTAPNVNAGNDVTVCQNAPVTLSGSGANSYSWNNGVTNGVAFNAASTTTYTVTGTGANGCTATDQVTVTVNTAPNVTASGAPMTICQGQTVTLNGNGATSYSWNNGVTNGVAFSPSSTQTYTVTGTDANGCTDTDQITIAVNALPNVSSNATAMSVCPGGTVTLTGGGANNYTWNNGVLDGVAFSPASTQTYTVTGTSSAGCTNTAQITIAVLPVPSVNAGNDVTVCQNAPVTLSGSGANSYSWNNGVTNGVAFNAASTTTYTVTGTGANGCTATDQVTVTVNAATNVTASGAPMTICQGQTVTLNGNGATSYSWNNGVTNGVAFAPSSTQTYTVTGTDANGCTDTDQITIAVNALPNVTASATSMSVCSGSTVTLTGGGAVNYTWSNGVLNGVAFAPTATQTYTVTGTNANGCTNTAQITVAVNAAPIVSAGTGGTICEGESFTLIASGAATYAWNNGAGPGATVIVSPTTSTIYTVTGTSLQGCTATDQVLVEVNAAPQLVTSGSTAICDGGSATLTVNGAGSYSWNNGAGSGTSVTVSPTATTTYTVTGTTAGCSATAQLTVTVNELPAISATGASTVCEGESVVLNATGGATYSWDNGAGNGASVTVSPTANTTYTVTGTDANGCVNTDAITVSVNPTPEPVVTVDGGTLETGTYSTYQWYVNNTPIPGATDPTLDYTENGDYYVVVTDGNGCEGTSEVVSITDAGIAEAQAQLIAVYPNPTNGAFTIAFGEVKGVKTVQLRDVSGKLVHTTVTSEQELKLEPKLAPGYYQVIVLSPKGAVIGSEKLLIGQ